MLFRFVFSLDECSFLFAFKKKSEMQSDNEPVHQTLWTYNQVIILLKTFTFLPISFQDKHSSTTYISAGEGGGGKY